ncbi:MAG: MGDG synthase family glycosyltransferase [Vicinamibacterales bacterium]
MRPRRVLILTLSFGSGHIRAAQAVSEALARQASDVEVRVVDALEDCRALFRAAYVWPYWLMIRYAPALWDRLFSARLRNPASTTAPAWAFRFGCPRVFDEIASFNPDVIVAAEVAACEMAVLARRADLTRAAIVSVLTDHEAEPAWVAPEVAAYAVADGGVAEQLAGWGAAASAIHTTGIPTDARFRSDPSDDPRQKTRVAPDRPMVLLMGGGMGPTRMDQIAEGLCASGEAMQIVAVAGRDIRMCDRLTAIEARRRDMASPASLTVLGWTDDIARLMKRADVLVTKPGGLTTAEAAIAGVPLVMFDAIPGPERRNAEQVTASGAGVLTDGVRETVDAVMTLIRDGARRAQMSSRGRRLACPSAAKAIAALVLTTPAPSPPVLMISIRNGAGHTRVAEAIERGLEAIAPEIPVTIVDAADYMSWTTRLTHVTIYLWLVRYLPGLWDLIDRYQKQQSHTSPEWYYRYGCRRLFDLVRRIRPRAIVATEVGCCEIAALIKRDLELACPLIAVNGEYDADRAWIQPEIDLYSVPSAAVAAELCAHGAPAWRVREWGVPLAPEFHAARDRADTRRGVCRQLGFDADRPIAIVSGGSEGLGCPDVVASRLLQSPSRPQVVVLAGRNDRLRRRAEALAADGAADRLRVLGWTENVAALMRAADVMVSKLGHTFDEAMALGLPLVALEPPPGSERVQYRLVEARSAGYAVKTLDEMLAAVERVLEAPRSPVAAVAETSGGDAAAAHIGRWLVDAIGHRSTAVAPARARVAAAVPLRVAEERE